MSGGTQDRPDPRQWFEAIVAHAPDAIVVLDVDTGRFVIANPQAERLFGMSAAQLRQVGPADVSPPTQPDGRSSAEAADALIELAVKGETPRFEWVHRHADGTDLLCEVNLLRLPSDEVTLVCGSIREIGERRRIEEAFRFLVSTSSDLICRHAPDGTWRYVSPASRRLGGYEPPELVGRHPLEFVHPDDHDRIQAQLAALDCWDAEATTCRWRRKNGGYCWLETVTSVVRDERSGEIVEIHTASREVTGRVEAEEALRRERDRSAALIASLPDGVAVIDGEGQVVEVNERWCEITGLRRDEVLGQRQPHRWWPPEQHERLTAFSERVRAGAAGEIVVELIRSSGERFPALISVSVLAGPADLGSLVVVMKDLTERARTQAALQASEERFKALVAQAPVGIFMADERGDNVYANERLQQLVDRSAAQLRGRAWVDHVHPDDRGRIVDGWYAAVSAGVEWSDEYRVATVGGAVRWAEASGRPLHDQEGRITGYLGTYIDVTERREAEEARRRAAAEQAAREEAHAAAAHLRRLLEETPAIVWVFRGPEHVIEVANARARQSVGNREPLIGLPIRTALPEVVGEGIFAFLDAVYNANEPLVETERRVVALWDGQPQERFYNAVLQPTRDLDGQATGIYAHIVDVTDQVQARRKAEKAEARLRSLVGGLAAIVWEADPATWQFTFVSERAEELLGYPPEQWSEPNFWVNIVHPDDRHWAVTYCSTETNAGRDHDFSYRAIAADGRCVWLHDIIHVVTTEDGTVTAMQGVMIDITEQKRAEQAIASSEARFRQVADAAPMLIRTFSADMRCTFCNQGWRDFVGCAAGEEAGYGWTESVHPADLDRCLDTYQSAFASRKPFEMEYRLRRYDGSYRWVLDRGMPIGGADGEFHGYISGCIDITERKRTEWASRLLAESSRLLVDQAPPDEHLQALARLAVPELGELCVIALRQDDGTLRQTAVAHVQPELEQAVRDLSPPGQHSPLFEAMRAERPVRITTQSGEPSAWQKLGLAAALVVPLLAHGRTFGSIVFGTSDPLRSYGPDDIALGEEWARRVALALDTMTLHSRTEQLQAIAAALASAATLEEVSCAVLEGASRALGACAGYVYQVKPEGSLTLVGFAGWPEDAMADWQTLGPEQQSPAVEVARTGAPMWLESATAWHAQYPHRPVQACEAAAIVPLILKGKPIGVVGLCFAGPRLLRPDERTFVRTLAEQCAQAFERARLYEEQRAIAHILQQSLLPSRRPHIPQLELDARYRPLGTAVEAGGDFYDIFETSRGWDFVIGDVCGKGPEAAQLTALCRYALRTAALGEPDDPPSRLLGLLNRVIISYQPDSSQFSTVAYASLRTDGDRLMLAVASGGHPPVLVVRRDGAIEYVKPAGCLLGLVADPLLEDAWVELEPGDLVLLYTDGVTESRRDGVLFGEQRLARLAAESAGRSVEDLLLRIEQAAVEFQDGPLRDDLALLGLRVRDVGQITTPRTVDLTFPAVPEVLSTLRGRLHDWLAAHGIPDTATYPLLLAATEAATNAIVHGYDGGDEHACLKIRGTLRNNEVTLVVTDSGGWKEPGRTEGGRGIAIMSRMMDGVEVIPSPHGTEVRLRLRLDREGKAQ